MATDQQVIKALRAAAASLLGRPLTPQEEADVVNRFNNATGTNRERALKTLRGFSRAIAR